MIAILSTAKLHEVDILLSPKWDVLCLRFFVTSPFLGIFIFTLGMRIICKLVLKGIFVILELRVPKHTRGVRGLDLKS